MIYCLSDIHGCYREFCKALEGINLDNKANKLVLCGDYVDRGPDSLLVLKKVMRLQNEYPDRVIALRGNHDDDLLTWVTARGEDPLLGEWTWTHGDPGFHTTKSLLQSQEWFEVERLLTAQKTSQAYLMAAEAVDERHHEMLRWLDSLPYFYETEAQIFAHAGVLEFCNYEECEDEWSPFKEGDDSDMEYFWRTGTTPDNFTGMRMQNYGHRFYKDVICGHTPTSAIVDEDGFCGIATDGAGHYYVDGATPISGVIPVLIYDENTKTYSGPGL